MLQRKLLFDASGAPETSFQKLRSSYWVYTGLSEYMARPIANRPSYQKNPELRQRNEKAGKFHFGDGNTFGFFRVDPAAERATLEIAGADEKTMFSVDLRP